MKKKDIKGKVQSVYDLLAKGKTQLAIEDLIDLTKFIDDNERIVAATMVSARFFRLQERLKKGIQAHEESDETKIVENILSILSEIEDTITNDEELVSKNIQEIEMATDQEDLVEMLRTFRNKTALIYNPSEEELQRIFDLKVGLYEQIFLKFDEKLKFIPILREKHSKVLFNRIFNSKELSVVDKQVVSEIIASRDYHWHEKTMIISSLMLSLNKTFDEQKVHLLIDFLTQFEEKVWLHALVGIVLTLSRYDKNIFLHNNIINRLEKLKEIDAVQEAIRMTDMFVSSGFYRLNLFSVEGIISSDKPFEVAAKKLAPFLKGMDVEYFNLITGGIFPDIISNMFTDSLEMAYEEDIENKKNGLLLSPYFESNFNWFVPFYMENPLVRSAIFNYKHDIDPRVLQDL